MKGQPISCLQCEHRTYHESASIRGKPLLYFCAKRNAGAKPPVQDSALLPRRIGVGVHKGAYVHANPSMNFCPLNLEKR
jgi:hypothetical protein